MKRNIILDNYRIILSMLIVFMHVFLGANINEEFLKSVSKLQYFIMWEIMQLAKLAVPTFFMISGFYLNLSNKKSVFKTLKKVLIVYIVWTLFYLPWCVYFSSIELFLNLLLGFYHLWYLSALFVGVAILYILNKYVHRKSLLLTLAVTLFIIGYTLQFLLGDHTLINTFISRNAFFYGLPYLIIGFVIKNSIANFKYKISKVHIIIFLLLVLTEGAIYLYKLNYHYDMLISPILAAPIIFIYILQNGKIKAVQHEDFPRISSGIYYIHPAVIMIFSKILPQVGNRVFFQYSFIVIISLFLTILIIEVNKRVKIFL